MKAKSTKPAVKKTASKKTTYKTEKKPLKTDKFGRPYKLSSALAIEDGSFIGKISLDPRRVATEYKVEFIPGTNGNFFKVTQLEVKKDIYTM